MSYNYHDGVVRVSRDLENEVVVQASDVETVQIGIAADGRTAWINVNGKCLLRLSRAAEIAVVDERQHCEESAE